MERQPERPGQILQSRQSTLLSTGQALLNDVSIPLAHLPVGGRLRYFLHEWKRYTSDPFILNMVSGMCLDLTDIPKQTKLPHQIHMTQKEMSVAKDHIKVLLDKQAIRETTFNPKTDFLSNVFLRPKPDGSYRIILNLKKFNQYIQYAHFKMESLQHILDLVTHNCFMCVLDLSDAYLTVTINKRFIRFLTFQFNGKYYCYIVLPFGISSAPQKFTKLLKPLVAWLRCHCIVLVIYIDDLWITAQTYGQCLCDMLTTANCLSSVGFLINKKKSKPEPSTRVIALGYVIDSAAMLVSLPLTKERDVIQHCENLYSSTSTPIRYVARVLGKIISCFPVIPHGHTHYRYLEHDKIQALLTNCFNYDANMVLSWKARKEVLWWIVNLPGAAAPINRNSPSVLLFVDVSLYGWGAYCPPRFTTGFFDDLEFAQSINTKETLAIWYALLAFLPHLQNQHILIRSDSTMAISYVSKFGGMNHPLRDLIARLIWQLAQDNNFWITISHIPGISNPADFYRRDLNHNLEWSLPKRLLYHNLRTLGVSNHRFVYFQIECATSRLHILVA